jgi:hypothetical protein
LFDVWISTLIFLGYLDKNGVNRCIKLTMQTYTQLIPKTRAKLLFFGATVKRNHIGKIGCPA